MFSKISLTSSMLIHCYIFKLEVKIYGAPHEDVQTTAQADGWMRLKQSRAKKDRR